MKNRTVKLNCRDSMPGIRPNNVLGSLDSLLPVRHVIFSMNAKLINTVQHGESHVLSHEISDDDKSKQKWQKDCPWLQ